MMKDKSTSSSSGSNPSQRSLYKEQDMRVGHVLGLAAANQMDPASTKIHLDHNRVCQPGFHRGNAADLIAMIQRNYASTDMAWTTDFIQSTPSAALALNIAADLVIEYQVEVDDYQMIMEQAYSSMLDDDPNFEVKCQAEINEALQSPNTQALIEQESEKLYNTFAEKNPSSNSEQKVQMHNDARRLAEFAIGKMVTNEIVGEYVSEKLPAIMGQLHIAKKTVHEESNNKDVIILGAAGSGKSHLLRTHMPHLKKQNMITLATDDYRGIHLPGSSKQEQMQTQQVFTRTQDSAYLVKELVMTRLGGFNNPSPSILRQQEVNTSGYPRPRPDVLFDGVTYERSLDAVIGSSRAALKSVVACLPEAREAPSRAYDRAMTSTNPADRGRFVNTEALIAGHKEVGGADLINRLPLCAEKTLLINTYTQGQAPQQFGFVTHSRNATNQTTATVHITNIKMAADYFGKQNLNPSAKYRHELYANKQSANSTDSFKYSNYHKARCLLQLVEMGDRKWTREKVIEFGDPPYVHIKKIKDDNTGVYKFDIRVLDEKKYKAELSSIDNPDHAKLLKEVVVQAKAYNKLNTTIAFKDGEVNTKILKERKTLGMANLEREHLPRLSY